LNKVQTISQPSQRDKEATPLLIASVGNTSVRLVLYQATKKVWDRRFSTRDLKPGSLPELPGGCSISLVSVVPKAAEVLIAHYKGHATLRIQAACIQNLPIAYDPPHALGTDRLVNALALKRRFSCGIVIDCGTATTLTVVDGAGVVVGGAILPGLEPSSAALAQFTAQLPAVSVEPVELAWGRDTAGAIQVGLWHGQVGAIAHLVEGMRKQLPPTARVVITGGWSQALAADLPLDYRLEPDWTIEGARLAWLEQVYP
jgi:type III pantothenate kinase